MRSISRCVWRNDVVLARKLLMYALAQELLDVDPETARVSLKDPQKFSDLLDTLQFQDAVSEQRMVTGQLAATKSESKRSKLRQRLRRLVRRSRLWAPFDRRLQLIGVRSGNRVITNQFEMQNAIATHWGQVFESKPVEEEAGQTYLDRWCTRFDLRDLPPPRFQDLDRYLSKLSDSAPGPDAVPYSACKTPRSPKRFSSRLSRGNSLGAP